MSSGEVGSQAGGEQPLVRLRGVTKRYGGLVAVADVDLDIAAGEVHVVAGENGAGKSTLMKLLAQAESPTTGEISLGGRRVAFHGPGEARRLGVAMVHQELALAPDLSIGENLFLGREPSRAGILRCGRQVAAAKDLLARVHLQVDPRRRARDLSVAQQQRVEIARALSVDARLVILDEPTASLDDAETEDLLRTLRMLADDGIAVLYISHKLDEVLRIADRVTVMRDGRVVATRPADGLDEATLVRLMVGRDVAELYPEHTRSPAQVVLRVSDLERADGIGPCSFEVRAGEIVGLAGLVGAGRTELVRAVYGADAVVGGSVEVDGRAVRPGSIADAMAAGIGYLSEDRKGEGLALGMSIAQNVTLGRVGTRWGVLKLEDEQLRADRRRAELGIRAASVRTAVRTLSGGNQQKVAVAKLLETDPRVLLLDEPARGIDVGAKAEMFTLVAQFAEQGRACLLISSYLPELLAMCDRVLVMRAGRLVGGIDRDQLSAEAVMRLATGMQGAA